MSIAVSLIALVLGYKIYVDASKEKEGLKFLGQSIGIFVMILAFAGTLCGISHKVCDMKSGYSSPMMQKSCPMMAKKTCSMSADSAS